MPTRLSYRANSVYIEPPLAPVKRDQLADDLKVINPDIEVLEDKVTFPSQYRPEEAESLVNGFLR